MQNLFTVQSKNGLKLEMYGFCTYKQCTNYTKPIPLKRLCMFFVHRNNIKTKQNLYNELTEMAFLCLLYKINTNLNWIIYVAADVYTKTLHSLLFKLSHQQRNGAILFCNFVKFQDQSFHIQKGSEMNLYNKFI